MGNSPSHVLSGVSRPGWWRRKYGTYLKWIQIRWLQLPVLPWLQVSHKFSVFKVCICKTISESTQNPNRISLPLPLSFFLSPSLSLPQNMYWVYWTLSTMHSLSYHLPWPLHSQSCQVGLNSPNTHTLPFSVGKLMVMYIKFIFQHILWSHLHYPIHVKCEILIRE